MNGRPLRGDVGGRPCSSCCNHSGHWAHGLVMYLEADDRACCHTGDVSYLLLQAVKAQGMGQLGRVYV